MSTQISPSAKKKYQSDGFYVAKGGFSEEKLGALRHDIRTIFKQYAKKGETVHETCIRLDKEDKDLLFRISRLTSRFVSMNEIVLECSRYALHFLPKGNYVVCEVGVLFGLPEDKRLVYNWHQESSYMPNYKHVVNFWFPVFEPSSYENGTMSCLTGSYKLGHLPAEKKKLAKNSFTDYIPENIEKIEKELKEHFFIQELGDIVMLDHDTIHRSNSNVSKKVRFSGIVRIASIDEVPD